MLTDDGRGFGPLGQRDGFGLLLLQALVDDVGGTFDLDNRHDGGTAMVVCLPATLAE